MILKDPGDPPLLESDGVDLDQSDPGVRSRTQSLLALLLLLLLLIGGEMAVGDVGSTATVERGRSTDRDLFGEMFCDRSGVRVPLSRLEDGSSRVSSSEKSVDPSSCEMCQSMLTFSNMVFFCWSTC